MSSDTVRRRPGGYKQTKRVVRRFVRLHPSESILLVGTAAVFMLAVFVMF